MVLYMLLVMHLELLCFNFLENNHIYHYGRHQGLNCDLIDVDSIFKQLPQQYAWNTYTYGV